MYGGRIRLGGKTSPQPCSMRDRHTQGHGSFTGCMFLVDFDQEFIIARKSSGIGFQPVDAGIASNQAASRRGDAEEVWMTGASNNPV
ncbi:hypothetical protein CKO51_22920 [Rhodopirellula sp. SM50]|nr:hypothetical protein CKO51_22920 [Rhodopirellula sp. SM50]